MASGTQASCFQRGKVEFCLSWTALIKNNDLRRSQGVLYIGADEPNLCSALLKIQSHVVLYQFKEKLQPPIANRLGPLAGGLAPVSFPVGRHVVRVELAPLFLTVLTLRPILMVVIQLLTVILRTPLALAPFAAADDLVWVIAGWSEQLLTIWTPAIHHDIASDDSPARLSTLSESISRISASDCVARTVWSVPP